MKKILIIEDDLALRVLMKDTLELHGYDILEAENGLIGVDHARKSLPDLIISDIYMAEGDGYAALKAVRAEASTASIPFILTTGQTDHQSLRRSMNEGADDYLPKPFTCDELVRAVNARLKKQDIVQQQAERSLHDLKNRLSLMLPHELNTPLSGILSISEILTSDAASFQPAEIAEMARGIRTSAERLRRLIQNFLLYSRIEILSASEEEIRTSYTQESTGVTDILNNEVWNRAHRAERPLDASLKLDEAELPISGEFFQKIVSELLDNSFKFSEPGTMVKVTCSSTESHYAVHFSDVGRGMTPEQIKTIGAYVQFDRKFYEQQGAGLGLFIARRLTELHRGSLKIESEPRKGTCVTIEFPRLDAVL